MLRPFTVQPGDAMTRPTIPAALICEPSSWTVMVAISGLLVVEEIDAQELKESLVLDPGWL